MSKAFTASQRAFFREIREKYSVTAEEYLALYKFQGGRCYICRKARGIGRRLGIDHCHITGRVRGLLCTGSKDPKTCNRLIAFFTTEALERAFQYTRNPPAYSFLGALRGGGVPCGDCGWIGDHSPLCPYHQCGVCGLFGEHEHE